MLKKTIILATTLLLLSNCSKHKEIEALVKILEKADTQKAINIAYEWRQKKVKGLKAYITTKNIIFEHNNKQIAAIAQPENKMAVSIAPYVYRTHG